MREGHEPAPLASTFCNTGERKIVLLRIRELQARIGLGRSAIYYLMNSSSQHYDKSFPRSVKISSQAVGWIEAEVDVWLEERITASRAIQKH